MDEMNTTVQSIPECKQNDLLYELNSEKYDLEVRILRLRRFLSEPTDKVSLYQQDLLAKQFALMVDYWDILHTRMLDIIVNHKEKK